MDTLEAAESYSFNPNSLAWLIRVDTHDDQRVSLRDLAAEIRQMDSLDPSHQNAHIIGLLAAQLTLNYINGADKQLHPVTEQSINIGMLGALGNFVITREPLYPDEMDNATTYQQQLLFWRALEDLPAQRRGATLPNARYNSVVAHMQFVIRIYPELLLDGRGSFRQWHGDMVEDYRTKVDTTMPTDDQIPEYTTDQDLTDAVQRFLQLRDSLRRYTPTLVQAEDSLWQYGRTYWNRIGLDIPEED